MTPSVPPPFALTDEAPPLTEEERSLLPSGPDIEFYAEHGWYLLVRRLPDGRPDYSDPEFCPVLWRGRTSNGLAHRAQEVGHVSLSLGPAASRNRSP